MTLQSQILAKVTARQTLARDLTTVAAPVGIEASVSLANGVLANQADLIFSDTRTIAPSGTDSLDLAGVLVDALGTTLTFARIKAVYVKAAAANANDVVVSRPATNGVPLFAAASDAINVNPGGLFLWASPSATAVPVTAGTGDLLSIANSGAGTSVTYDIVIIGASA